jgi:hypothetical protein
MFQKQVGELTQLVNALDVKSIADEEVEGARLQLSVLKDAVREKMLVLSERYNQIAATREALRKVGNLSDAEKAALAQIIQAGGIDNGAKPGKPG